jgi:hypothetical protein
MKGKVSSRFLKKAAPKTFVHWGRFVGRAHDPRCKSFFGYFFFKKSNLFLGPSS